MTVRPPRSRDCGAHPALPVAGGRPARSSLRPSPSQLPPPPATLPPNFTPAFLGFAASRGPASTASGSGAGPRSPALRAPAATSAATRRLQCDVAGELLLPTPTQVVCDKVNANLAAWRTAGCPATSSSSMSAAPNGILRAPVSAINAAAPPRQLKRVSFCIPVPTIQDDGSPPSSLRLHDASHRHPLPRNPAPRGSRSPSSDGPWTTVLSRRARANARRAARQDGPLMPRRASSHRPADGGYQRPMRTSSSRDGHGGCPRGRSPPRAPATRALPLRVAPRWQLSPPHATIPPTFRPAYLGVTPERAGSASGRAASVGAVDVNYLARPARRGPATPSTPTSRTPSSSSASVTPRLATPPSSRSGAAPRSMVFGSLCFAHTSPTPTPPFQSLPRLQHIDVGVLTRPSYPPPPPATLPMGFTPAFLGFGSALAPQAPGELAVPSRESKTSMEGILRTAASKASAPTRPPRSVSFSIPAPFHVHGSSGGKEVAPSRPCLQAGSHRRPISDSLAAKDSSNTSPDAPWIHVLSRRARCGARRAAREKSPSLPRRFTSTRHSLNSSTPHHHPRSRHRRPRPCFRCQATDHVVAGCRDPVRCSGCRRWGHRVRDCVEPPRLRQLPVGSPSPARHCPPPPLPRPAPSTPPPSHMRSMALRSSRDGDRARERSPRSPRRHEGGSHRHERHHRSPPRLATVQRVESICPLRSFADVLLARPEMDLCYITATQMDLASERCYMECVDGALAEENDSVGIGLLLIQGVDHDCEALELDVHLHLSPASVGEVLTPHASCPDLACSPLLAGRDTLLSPGAGLTMVLTSPGDASCDRGPFSEDEEVQDADGEMQQLLTCPAEMGQQVMLLDEEKVAHGDDLDNNHDLARRESQPVADVEVVVLGNLLTTDDDDVADDEDDVHTGDSARASSGTTIRSVADLFCLPVVPLLPMPLPSMPRAPAAAPEPARRSSRLAEKPQLPAVDKAMRVLHKKMGLDFGDMPLVQATKEFANTCKQSPFSASTIEGLNILFKLNLPSMTAVDEALIGLAGPGGNDFPPPTALDVSA